MAADLIVAADFGTSGVKLGVVDRGLRLVARAQERYPLRLDSDAGIAEQNPQDWWQALGRGLAELRRQVPDLPERAAAVVFTAQMCGVICVDETGLPLRPCLTWLDKRAGETARRLVGGFPAYRGYGLVKLARWLRIANGAPSLNGADPIAKMAWLRDNEPEVWSRTRTLLDVKDWLLLRATGRAVTTPDCANLTWMMDSRPGRVGWSDALVAFAGIDRALLPDIVDGAAVAGGLRDDAAAFLGLRSGVPVVAGAGDLGATAMGTGAVDDGALHIHVGTSSWIGGFFPSRRLHIDPSYATIASAADGRPLLIATQETSGECLSWAARAVGEGETPEDIGKLMDAVAQCEPGAKNPFFLPWLAGERMPVDDERLRSAFLGLSLGHGPAHLARAVVEGICLNLRWAMEAVEGERGIKDGPIPVAGGVLANRVFCQCLADVLQRPLQMLEEAQSVGVLGASAIAAAAVGWYPSPWDASRKLSERAAELVKPDIRLAPLYARRLELFKGAQRRLAPWFHSL